MAFAFNTVDSACGAVKAHRRPRDRGLAAMCGVFKGVKTLIGNIPLLANLQGATQIYTGLHTGQKFTVSWSAGCPSIIGDAANAAWA